MKTTQLFALTALLSLSACPVWADAADGCHPEVAIDDVSSHLASSDAISLAGSLLADTRLEDDFERSKGLDAVASTLASKAVAKHGAKILSRPKVAEVAAGLSDGLAAGCAKLAEGESVQAASKAAVLASNLVGGDSQYYFFTGIVNSLEADGSFSSGLEVALTSQTYFPLSDMPLFGRMNSSRELIGTFEISHSEIGRIDETDEGMTDPQNPFAVGGGFFRLNASLDGKFSPGARNSGVGWRVGTGFSTQPSEVENDVDARARFYAGTVIRANYGDDERGQNGRGEVFIGFAKDEFWRYETQVGDTLMEINESERIVVDGRMDLPGVFSSNQVRLSARLFADLPASGDGPSDIRISLLVTANIGSLFGIP